MSIKLERLSLASGSSLIFYLRVRPEPTQVEQLSEVDSWPYWTGLKGLEWINALAYFAPPQGTKKKKVFQNL